MAANPVTELCVAWGTALKSAEGVEGAARLPFFAAAMEAARKGAAEFPGAELPRGTTWARMIDLVERKMQATAAEMDAVKDEPASQEESVQEPAPVESQPQEQVYRVMSDGEVFGETPDLQEAKDVAQELGDATVVDSAGVQVFPEAKSEPEQPKVETLKEKLARKLAEKRAAEQQAAPAAKPEPEPEPEVTVPEPLRIVHDSQYGTTVYGTAKGDGANGVLKPLGWRFFFRKDEGIGVWYIDRSKGYAADMGKIQAAREALERAGFEVELDIATVGEDGQPFPVKLTAEQRKAQKAAEQAERRAAAASAREAAAAARAAAAPAVEMPGLELFAEAAVSIAAPEAAKPVKRQTRRSRKPSLPLEGLASVEGALWWRVGVREGVSPKDTATAVRRALRTVVEAHHVEDEEDLKVEVRLHKGSRTLLIGAVLPEREMVGVDPKLLDAQIPGVASLLATVERQVPGSGDVEYVIGVGSMVESHSDF